MVEEEAPRLSFTVYWINLGKAAGEPFFLRLVTTEGRTVSEGIARPNEEATMIGQMMSADGVLEIPADLPVEPYHWQVGIYTAAVESGELVFDLPLDLTLLSLP